MHRWGYERALYIYIAQILKDTSRKSNKVSLYVNDILNSADFECDWSVENFFDKSPGVLLLLLPPN